MNDKKNFDTIQVGIICAAGVVSIPIILLMLFFKHLDEMSGFLGTIVLLPILGGLVAFGYFISNVVIAFLKELKNK